jgi:hypothetical protein
MTGELDTKKSLANRGILRSCMVARPPTKPNITNSTHQLARWLGISHHVGSDLSYWLITENGKIISKTSVEHVICDDYLQTDKKQEIEEFNRKLEASLDDANLIIDGKGEFNSLYLEDTNDDFN